MTTEKEGTRTWRNIRYTDYFHVFRTEPRSGAPQFDTAALRSLADRLDTEFSARQGREKNEKELMLKRIKELEIALTKAEKILSQPARENLEPRWTPERS